MAVSGPRHENIRNPSTFNALCHWASSACGSAATWSAMLAHNMSTLPGSGASNRGNGVFQRAGIHHGFTILLIAACAVFTLASTTKHCDFGYFLTSCWWFCKPPRTAPQWAQACGCSLIHCKRSSMRLATSSCSQGDANGAMRCQRATAMGSRVGGLWFLFCMARAPSILTG